MGQCMGCMYSFSMPFSEVEMPFKYVESLIFNYLHNLRKSETRKGTFDLSTILHRIDTKNDQCLSLPGVPKPKLNLRARVEEETAIFGGSGDSNMLFLESCSKTEDSKVCHGGK